MRLFRFALAALPLLAGCASAGGGASSDGKVEGRPTRQEVRIEVRNDATPRRGATIRILSSAGSRGLLGTVSPGQTTTLSYTQPGFQGRYSLVAEFDGGPDLRSTTITLRDGMHLVWSLQANTLIEVD